MDEHEIQTNGLSAFRQLFANAEEKKFEAGQTVFSEGDGDSHFYWIQSGAVAIDKKTTEGELKQIARLRAGDFVGEGALLGSTQKPATARATEPAVLLVLSAAQFDEAVRREPKTVVAFLLRALESTANRLEGANTKLLALFEIGRLLEQEKNDLKGLGEALVRKLLALTQSAEGMLCLRNPFSKTYRVVFSTLPSWKEHGFEGVSLSGAHSLRRPEGETLIADLRGLGFLALRRPVGKPPYSEDQLRLVTLVADQAVGAIQAVSAQNLQKDRQKLERRYVEF